MPLFILTVKRRIRYSRTRRPRAKYYRTLRGRGLSPQTAARPTWATSGARSREGKGKMPSRRPTALCYASPRKQNSITPTPGPDAPGPKRSPQPPKRRRVSERARWPLRRSCPHSDPAPPRAATGAGQGEADLGADDEARRSWSWCGMRRRSAMFSSVHLRPSAGVERAAERAAGDSGDDRLGGALIGDVPPRGLRASGEG
jgi:hypothetical protein